jgi:outer membrane lipoprotein-sorting protein
VLRLLLAVTGTAMAQAESLDAILARMDTAARQFSSLTAHIQQTHFTPVFNESEVSSGMIHMKRAKSGALVLIEYGGPNARSIAIGPRTVQRYFPKAGVVEVYDTARYTNTIDQHLLLGFGTTAMELKKLYDMKVAGTETLGPVSTTRIELTPKSAETLKLISKIELWIPEGQGNPAQEKITERSRETDLAVYSDTQLNASLPDSEFELKLPAGVKKLYPQK